MTREQKIIRASWWAIFGNALLAFMKLAAGFISGSYVVIADGIDSVSDIASSLVVLVAARIIAKPPNVKFPSGTCTFNSDPSTISSCKYVDIRPLLIFFTPI